MLPDGERIVSYSLHPATVNGPAHARDGARRAASEYRDRGLVPTVVHVRTYRVEVVYAWAMAGVRRIGCCWWCVGSRGTMGRATVAAHWALRNDRALFADPLGKHSRRRAKKAALAARPSGPCVLVAVRRRVRETRTMARDEMVPRIAAELRAAHDAGVAEGKASEREGCAEICEALWRGDRQAIDRRVEEARAAGVAEAMRKCADELRTFLALGYMVPEDVAAFLQALPARWDAR